MIKDPERYEVARVEPDNNHGVLGVDYYDVKRRGLEVRDDSDAE
jgi:hypothetical protein